MLSYFKYYIIKTQQARNSIVLKLCGCAAAFRPDVWGCGPQVGGRGVGGVRGCRNITARCSIGTWMVCASACAGNEVHSGRAEESGHEVVDGETTDASLSTADPSHVHVGLRRAANGAFCTSRSLDA